MNILFVVIKLNVCHFILYYQEVNLTLYLQQEICLKKSVLKSFPVFKRVCLCCFNFLSSIDFFKNLLYFSLSGWFPQIGPAASASFCEFDVFHCSLFFYCCCICFNLMLQSYGLCFGINVRTMLVLR